MPILRIRDGSSPTAAEACHAPPLQERREGGAHFVGCDERSGVLDPVHQPDEGGIDRGVPADEGGLVDHRAVEVVDLGRLAAADALQRRAGVRVRPIRRLISSGTTWATVSGLRATNRRMVSVSPCRLPNRTPAARAMRTASRRLAVTISRRCRSLRVSCTLRPVIAGMALIWLTMSFVHWHPVKFAVASLGMTAPSTRATVRVAAFGAPSPEPR